MAAEKTAPPTRDPFAWEDDPLVLVSRRHRAIDFPTALLRGDMSPEAVARYKVPPDQAIGGGRDSKSLHLIAGVNFLGARTTSWAFRALGPNQAPQGAPTDKLATIFPFCTGADIMTAQGGVNWDRDAGKVKPSGIRETLLRVLAYHKEHDQPHLWATVDGFDAPELMLVRLGDLFSQRGDMGQHAHVATVTAIPHLRRTDEVIAPLGALHDYAVRHRAGLSIVGACRTWAQRKQLPSA